MARAVSSASKDKVSPGAHKDAYVPPPLLPSPGEDDVDADDRPANTPTCGFTSSEQPRRKPSALIAPPSVPSLLAEQTSAMVVGWDAKFVADACALLEGMGVVAVGLASVGEALDVLEEDITANGCITFDQILCEVDRDEDEGGETLIAELRSTSWPASVALVTSGWPTAAQLSEYGKTGARAVLRKPINPAELARLFTHLKRKPHEHLWQAGRMPSLKSGAAMMHAPVPQRKGRATPLHITAMGVGMVAFLHVHAGRAKGPNPQQTFKHAAAFECDTMPGVEGVNPEWIYRFVVIVMVNLQLDEELLVTAVILLERACRVSQLVLTETNWQSVLLAAIVIAAKTHYDEAVWLGDFVNRLRMYPLDSAYLHDIEMAFLRAIRFCVIVRPSSFYRYSSEILTLHDTYCPYRKSMTCDLVYRMQVRTCSTKGALSQFNCFGRSDSQTCGSSSTASDSSSQCGTCAES